MKPLAESAAVSRLDAGDAGPVRRGIDTAVFFGAFFLLLRHMSSIHYALGRRGGGADHEEAWRKSHSGEASVL